MGYGHGRGRRRANPWLQCPKAGCCDDKGQRSYSYLPQIEKNEGKCPRCKAHWSKADLAWVRGQAAQTSPDAKPAAQPLAAAPPSVPSVGILTPQHLPPQKAEKTSLYFGLILGLILVLKMRVLLCCFKIDFGVFSGGVPAE